MAKTAKQKVVDIASAIDMAVVGPNLRPDANPPHGNPIRAFREELRLTRKEFSKLAGVDVETLRKWEVPKDARPHGERALKLVALARRNRYPLTMEDIYSGK